MAAVSVTTHRVAFSRGPSAIGSIIGPAESVVKAHLRARESTREDVSQAQEESMFILEHADRIVIVVCRGNGVDLETTPRWHGRANMAVGSPTPPAPDGPGPWARSW